MTSRRKKARRMKPSSGSPNAGGPEFLVVGKLHKPHGVRGEMRMSVWTDFPERIVPGVELLVGREYRPLIVRSVRWHHQDMLIAFEEYRDRDQVGELRNQLLYVRAADRPELEEGEFYLHQLLGLRVVSDEGEDLGRVEKILETGANNVFIVRSSDGGEVLLPDIDSVVLSIDLAAGEIRVHLLPGLLPDR